MAGRKTHLSLTARGSWIPEICPPAPRSTRCIERPASVRKIANLGIGDSFRRGTDGDVAFEDPRLSGGARGGGLRNAFQPGRRGDPRLLGEGALRLSTVDHASGTRRKSAGSGMRRSAPSARGGAPSSDRGRPSAGRDAAGLREIRRRSCPESAGSFSVSS